MAAIPVLAVVGDRELFRNPLSWLQGLGICLSVLGVFLVNLRRRPAGVRLPTS